MANRWADGFGRYGDDEAKMLNGSSGQAWAQVDTGSWSLSTANPRTGTRHLRLIDGANDAGVRRVFGEPLTEVLFGQALYFNVLPTHEPIVDTANYNGFFLAKFRTAANLAQISVWLGTDGAIVVYREGEERSGSGVFNGTLLGRSLPCVGAGAYQHFEHYMKVGTSDGAYELRVDEVTVLNLTGINTDYSAAGEVSQVIVGRAGDVPFAATGITDMADCFVNDTTDDGSGCDTFIGDTKCGVLMVNADTAQSDFTLSAGVSGYELLDEIPANDADYIETDVTTAESDFGLQDGPASLTEILTIRPFNRAWKDDAGTCTIAPSLISNGDKAAVDDQPITTAPAYYDSNVPLNPDTGVPWTLSDLNAAYLVVERVS